MKIFISWSGDRSKHIAKSLRAWLPKVIQAVDPWMSDEDIETGARWSTEVAANLNACSFGIICVTPENQNGSWLNFEAGALSKVVNRSAVCPYLYELGPSQLSGPLSQFQAITASEEGTKKLVVAVNTALDIARVNSSQIEETFSVWWAKLSDEMQSTPSLKSVPQSPRSDQDLLQEIVLNTREQLRRENVRLTSNTKLEEQFEGTLGRMTNLISTIQSTAEGKPNARSKGSTTSNDAVRPLLSKEMSDALASLVEGRQLMDNFRESIINPCSIDEVETSSSATKS